MQFADVLKWLINLVAGYWNFQVTDFEHFEVDQRPDFYLMIVTLRPKKEG